MSDRTTSTHQHHHTAYGQVFSTAVVVMLFTAVLLFGILVALRYAHGSPEIAFETAAAVPMAGDGVVAIVAALAAGAGVVWLYVKRLAH